jgi:hypothetical protein
MSYSDIDGTPAQVDLYFVNRDTQPPPASHPLGGAAGAFIRAVLLPQLPTNAQTALNQLLSTPLDQIFDQAWTQLQGTAQSMVQQAVQGAQPNAYNIQVSLPAGGSLRAQVGNVSPGMLDTLPPGTPAMQLTLVYSVPGFSVTFSETTSGIFGSWADPSYNLTFDGAIEIAIAVPHNSLIPLGAKAQFLTTNMQGGAGNLFAVLIGIEDAISNYLNQRPQGSGSSLQDQIVPINIPALQQLFGEMSSGFATAARFGFTQLGVQINTNPPAGTAPGNTVEFDLTHPFDPGPVISNRVSTAPNFFSPQIGTSAPQVNAGSALGITGSYFPSAQAGQLAITWNDTTSGNVVQSEIQWGVASGGQPPTTPLDVMISRNGAYDNLNNFTAKGLAANTAYAFRVRDFDIADFIATDWSTWAVLTTTGSDQVQLVLSYQDQELGSATLQSDGSFTTTVTIPGSVPAGTYQISAVSGGHTLAQTPITVVAKGKTLAPVLQTINPNTGIANTLLPVILAGNAELLRGANFNPGLVVLSIETTDVSLGLAIANASGVFSATIHWPLNLQGQYNLLAQQGSLQATAPIYGENPPR